MCVFSSNCFERLDGEREPSLDIPHSSKRIRGRVFKPSDLYSRSSSPPQTGSPRVLVRTAAGLTGRGVCQASWRGSFHLPVTYPSRLPAALTSTRSMRRKGWFAPTFPAAATGVCVAGCMVIVRGVLPRLRAHVCPPCTSFRWHGLFRLSRACGGSLGFSWVPGGGLDHRH